MIKLPDNFQKKKSYCLSSFFVKFLTLSVIPQFFILVVGFLLFLVLLLFFFFDLRKF